MGGMMRFTLLWVCTSLLFSLFLYNAHSAAFFPPFIPSRIQFFPQSQLLLRSAINSFGLMTAATNHPCPPNNRPSTPSGRRREAEMDGKKDKNNNENEKANGGPQMVALAATTSKIEGIIGGGEGAMRRRPVRGRNDEEGAEEMGRFGRSSSKALLRLVLPSNYAKRLLPSGLYRLCCYGAYLFWFTIGILVLRKTRSATSAVHYVKTHGHTVSLASIENSVQFSDLLAQIESMDQRRPPAILMLNQFALNMTFNFLCNTAIFPGVHDRFIFVTLDSKSRDVLREYWPRIRQFHWPTPSLYKPFSFAEGAYQTIYLFRANLAVALIKKGKSFWMQQQDTFWRRNLFDIGLEDEPGFDLLFDQIGHGNNSKRAEWVNGANFFVRANSQTQQFFEAIAAKLAHWYTPDMGIMIHQCHTWGRPICKFIPHRIAHSWEWMYTEQREPPHVIQLDCETDGGSKLQQLARFGFHFTMADGRTCNYEAVHRAQIAMEQGKVGVEGPTKLSWGRLQFKVYWWLVDYILCTPLLGPLLKPYLPLVGYILMITLA